MASPVWCTPENVSDYLQYEIKNAPPQGGYAAFRVKIDYKDNLRLHFPNKTPLIIPILDISGSMNERNKLQDAKKALKDFYGICMANQSVYPVELAIVGFNHEAHVFLNKTQSFAEVEIDKILEELYAEGSTDFKVALAKAAELSKEALDEGRPCVFAVFTDGHDQSSLKHEMESFHFKGVQTELLHTLKNSATLSIHTIGIGSRQALPEAFLKELATFPELSGETAVIDGSEFSTVMACLYAAMVESVPLPCSLVLEPMEDDKQRPAVKKVVIPISLRVGAGLSGACAAFFADKSFKVSFWMGGKQVWEEAVDYSSINKVDEETDVQLAAVEAMLPTLQLSAFKSVQNLDFTEALEEITKSLACLRAVSCNVSLLQKAEARIGVLRGHIEEMQEHVRCTSEAGTVVSERAIQWLPAATQDLRSLSGGASLLPDRRSSALARALSEPFNSQESF